MQKQKKSRAQRELDQKIDRALHARLCGSGYSMFTPLITEGRHDGLTERTYFCKNCGLKELMLIPDPPAPKTVPVATRKPLPEDIWTD